MEAGEVSASAIAIGQTVVAYQFFLPKLSDVRRADDSVTRRDVYLGQFAAGAVSLAVSVMFGWMTGSPIPVYVSLIIAVIIAGVYHYAMESEQ